jgi:hypothetical protein
MRGSDTRAFFSTHRLKRRAASSPEYAEQQSRKEDDDKDEEQDLGDFRRACCDSTEAEKGRNDRDDEKNDSVPKHEASHVEQLDG